MFLIITDWCDYGLIGGAVRPHNIFNGDVTVWSVPLYDKRVSKLLWT